MAEVSKIEWTDATFNPWIGCTRVSTACDHCYAAASTPARALGVAWGNGQPRRRTSAANWKLPLRWNGLPFYECTSCGWRGEKPLLGAFCPRGGGGKGCGSGPIREARRRVFCASLADVFDNEVDPQWRIDLLELIAATPNLDWLLLTKRIGNAERMLDAALDVMSHGLTRWRDVPWPNVWLGATICDQDEADRDIPKLLAVPAEVRFLSMEPLLGPVDLRLTQRAPCWAGDGPSATEISPVGRGIHWVIAGGESGPHARPMHPEWVRDLRDQCTAARVPFLFKQWGEWIPYEDSDRPPFKLSQHGHEIDGHWLPDFESEDGEKQRDWLCDWSHMLLARRVGKKAAGRLLDGVEHSSFPGIRHAW